MSGNRFVFSGLDELRTELRNLPTELAAEAGAIVSGAADAAKSEIVAAYPERTGNLKKGVKVTHGAAGAFGARSVVKNTAKHAYIFENGTQARHTDIGANRGSMPPGHVFIPIVVRRRRAMYDQLIELVKRQGLQVSGTP